MNSEELDKILQHKLGLIQPRPADDAWEILARRMDRESDSTASSSPIDEALRNKLGSLNPRYQGSHWQRLADRLKAESILRRRLLLSKSLELSMVALIIFTAIRFTGLDQGPLDSGKQEGQTPIAGLQQNVQEISATSNIEISSRAGALTTQADISERENAGSLAAPDSRDAGNQKRMHSRQRTHQSGNLATHQAKRPVVSNDNNNQAADRYNARIQDQFPPSSSAAASVQVNTSPSGIKTGSAPEQPLAEQNIPAVRLADGTVPEKTDQAASAVAKGEFTELTALPMSAIYLEAMPVHEEISSRIRKSKLSRIWTPTLGLVCGFSNNKIQTPKGGLYSQEFSQQNWISPEIGFTFLLDNQLFGVESGLYYSYIQYKGILPRYNSVHFMKVPLNFRIIPLQQEEWNLYFVAGATLHIAASAKYDKPLPMELVGGPGPYPEADVYEYGLFEGGDYKSNTYYTYNVGVGFERYYNNNMRVFGQILRTRSLFDDRFSPSLNKIKATAFQIGMRIPIK